MLLRGQMRSLHAATLVAGALLFAACTTTPATGALASTAPAQASVEQAKFEQDRQAILAMAGNFDVDFDFRETVPLAAGYQLKKPKRTGGSEIIRVVEDRGTFISLQQLLVVGEGEDSGVVKHWRQDWTYEPASVLVFIGGNAWETRPVPAAERAGKWSQTVYQVEDSPRYGAVGAWTHDNGVSQWTSSAEIRPLPRRDMTSRDDYDAMLAVNRHVITPFGWVQEEDNSKLVLRGAPHTLVREVGVNTYRHTNDFAVKRGEAYWAATKDFWALIRADWAKLEKNHSAFGLTIQGEPEALYIPILTLADDVEAGTITTADAAAQAGKIITALTTADIGDLASRLRQSAKQGAAY
jgi:hypothetical protein